MSWWEKYNVECQNCTEERIDFIMEDDRGKCILWCRACGTLLKAYLNEPISFSDYKIPRLNVLNDYAT